MAGDEDADQGSGSGIRRGTLRQRNANRSLPQTYGVRFFRVAPSSPISSGLLFHGGKL